MTTDRIPRSRVVIIGAGFGGFQTAQSLAAEPYLDITLIDRQGHHVFTPLIYQVATGILEPQVTVAAPRSHLPEQVKVLAATVNWVDVDHRSVMTDQGQFFYDFLVLATGAQARIADVPGARRYAFPLGTLDHAIALRQRLAQCLQNAGPTYIPSVAIVGGGTTGAELSGSLAEWARLLGKPITIHWIHSGTEVLSEFAAPSGRAARSRLQRLGVKTWLETRVTQVSDRAVTVNDGDRDHTIAADIVVWTAGMAATMPNLSTPLDTGPQGKLQIRPTLQVRDRRFDQVYAIGDLALCDAPLPPIPAVAPVALQQGVAVARNIRRQRRGQSPRPFRYFNKGRLAIVGGYLGVGHIAGISFSGVIAWILWLGVHWVYLPGWKNRRAAAIAWWHAYGPGQRSRLPLHTLLPVHRSTP